jgi:hypothetical protein
MNTNKTTRHRPGRASYTQTTAIRRTPAAETLRRAITASAEAGAIPCGAVPLLSGLIGHPAGKAERRALLFCLSEGVNLDRIRPLEAHHAARCLGGWQ